MGVTEKQLKRYSARARRRRRLRRLTLLMLVLAAAFLLIDRNFRPLVFSLAEARSAAMATRALNGALTEALEDGVEYDDLMNVRMDDSGQVSLLSANTMRMNDLADRAGDAALRKLETVSAQKVYVPLGAALGLTLFAGSGPRIPISIVPVGTVQTDFETEFEPAASTRRGTRFICSSRPAFASSFRRAQRRRTSAQTCSWLNQSSLAKCRRASWAIT